MLASRPFRRALARASLLASLSLVAFTGAPDARAQDTTARMDEAKARAEVHFKKGIEAYKAGQYKAAIDAFLDAHREFPSPTLSFNTARAYDKMGDAAGALRFYREYLRQSPDAKDGPAVEARIAEHEKYLQSRGLQQVTVLSEPDGATVFIDDRPVGVTPWTGELLAGRHRLRLKREGYADKEQMFDLRADKSQDVALTLDRAAAQTPATPTTPNEPTSPSPTAAPTADSGGKIGIATWTAFGVGAAALGGALAFELMRGAAEDDVKNEETQVARHDAFDTMESRQTTARVLAGVGAVATLAGGVLLYFDLQKSESNSPSARVGVGAVGSGTGATLRGSF